MPNRSSSRSELRVLRRYILWIAGALAGIALTTGVVAWTHASTQEWVLNSRAAARTAQRVLRLSLDRESGVRGYLLSRREESLEAERAARAQIPALFDSLTRLSEYDAEQRARVDTSRESLERWDAEFAAPVMRAVAAGEPLGAEWPLAGKPLFDRVREPLEAYIEKEWLLHRERLARQRTVEWVALGAVLLEVAVLLVVFLALGRRLGEKAALVLEQREQLEEQAVELEEQAAELEEQAVELEQQVEESQSLARELEESSEVVRAAERRYRSVVEHASDLVAVLDAEGRFAYASPASEQILGIDPASLRGTDPMDLVHPEDIPRAQAMLAESLASPDRLVSTQLRSRHADGSWRVVELRGVNLLDDPAVGGIVFNTRDLTEQHRLEAQLLQAQKMEAVGRLAGGIAHDFNNMLTAIKSYSQLALDELEEGAPVRDDVREIDHAADRAATLTRQLLAFSRQQVLRPRVLDLNETVRGLEGMLRRLLMEDVTLEVRLDPAVGRVEADPGQVEQVLMNLVVNARDAMPDGGQLTVGTSNAVVEEKNRIEYGSSVFAPGRYVVLAVSDTGSGMDRETQAKIFDPFFTTKEQGKGTGLGLSTVYGIVKQSGGYIWVYSEPGQGTTFKVYLPRVDERVAVASPVSVPAVAAPGATTAERILVVEDDDTVREVTRRILERAGYETIEAANGADALRLVEASGEGIALVISDLIMPEMRGTELALRLRERFPALKVLLVSGYTEDAVMRQRTFEMETAFLEKPFTPDALVRMVRRTLDGVAG